MLSREALLSTDFSYCVDPNSYPLGVANHFCNAGMMSYLDKWAISSFEHFNSPGSDAIFSPLVFKRSHLYFFKLWRDLLIYI